MPASAPTTMPKSRRQHAMISSTQPPSSTRERTSRPSTSVPSGYVPDGGCERQALELVGRMWRDERSDRTRPAPPAPAIVSPIAPRRVRAACQQGTQPLTVSCAACGNVVCRTVSAHYDRANRRRGVASSAIDVRDDVDDDIDRGEHDNDELDHRNVSIGDRADEPLADTRKVEDVLHHDDPAGQVEEVQADHLDRRRHARSAVRAPTRSATRTSLRDAPSRRSRTPTPRSSPPASSGRCTG